MWKTFWFLNFLLLLVEVYLYPSQSFVTTTEVSTQNVKEGSPSNLNEVPEIYEMLVSANVSNRFAQTLVTSRVRNLASKAKETAFSVVIPETAYISGFVLEIGGKKYTAYVKEKEEAKQIFDEAVQQGISAAHVAASARDSNRFDVSVNLEPQSKAIFHLSYEELLRRENGQYEIVINIHPGQPVANLEVDVHINESRPLKFVRPSSIRSGNEISKYSKEDLDPRVEISQADNTTADVKFVPSVERQKQLAHSLGTKEDDGLAGQFVVQYDVERDPNGGEVLLQDGYFVHFFAPTEVTPLPKQVVFVLDTSGSMYDRKLEQLKQAMKSILGELKNEDIFNIVEFNTVVHVWNLQNKVPVTYPKQDPDSWYSSETANLENITKLDLPAASTVTPENIKQATETVQGFNANGGTNIHAALLVALRLVEMASPKEDDKIRHQPLILFLTDGDPTVDISDTKEIIKRVSEANTGKRHSPIFALSFGDGADKKFLQELSLRNEGFSRHIYEAADASLQLEDFYRIISSPLLNNVTFKYTPSVSKVTKTTFPLLFGGSELAVAGTIDKEVSYDNLDFQVEGWGVHGSVYLKPVVERPVTHLERLWAYLTVKQILEAKETAENKTVYDKMALDLALKYSFVTPVSSLVVVKPNDTNMAVDTVAADRIPPLPIPGRRLGASARRRMKLTSYQHSYSGQRPISGLTTFGKSQFSSYSGSTPLYFANRGPVPASAAPNYYSASRSYNAQGYRGSSNTHYLALSSFSSGAPIPRYPAQGYRGSSNTHYLALSSFSSFSSGAPIPRYPVAAQSYVPLTANYAPGAAVLPGVPQAASAGFQPNYPVQPISLESFDTVDQLESQTAEAATSEQPISTTEEPSTLESLKVSLPWISSLLTDNDILATSKGTYKLGLNETFPDGDPCKNTPLNGNGKCALLHECPAVLNLITNVNIFQQYVCDVKGFAGICCPVDKYEQRGHVQ